MKREIDILVEQLCCIPDGRLDEYLEGKCLVKPETLKYEESAAAEAAYKQGRANVAHNMKRKAEGKKR